jgi:hypothetical protein
MQYILDNPRTNTSIIASKKSNKMQIVYGKWHGNTKSTITHPSRAAYFSESVMDDVRKYTLNLPSDIDRELYKSIVHVVSDINEFNVNGQHVKIMEQITETAATIKRLFHDGLLEKVVDHMIKRYDKSTTGPYATDSMLGLVMVGKLMMPIMGEYMTILSSCANKHEMMTSIVETIYPKSLQSVSKLYEVVADVGGHTESIANHIFIRTLNLIKLDTAAPRSEYDFYTYISSAAKKRHESNLLVERDREMRA